MHAVVALFLAQKRCSGLLSLRPTFCRPALSAEVHLCQTHCPTTTWRRLRAPALFLEAPPCHHMEAEGLRGPRSALADPTYARGVTQPVVSYLDLLSDSEGTTYREGDGRGTVSKSRMRGLADALPQTCKHSRVGGIFAPPR